MFIVYLDTTERFLKEQLVIFYFAVAFISRVYVLDALVWCEVKKIKSWCWFDFGRSLSV